METQDVGAYFVPQGEIVLAPSPPRPMGYEIRLNGEEPQVHIEGYPTSGLHWEADAAARAVRDDRSLWLVKLVERTGPLYSYVREQVTPVG